MDDLLAIGSRSLIDRETEVKPGQHFTVIRMADRDITEVRCLGEGEAGARKNSAGRDRRRYGC